MYDEECCAAIEHDEDNQTDKEEKRKVPELPEYSPSLDEKNVEIVFRCGELKTTIEVAVTNTISLTNDRMIFILRSDADGSRLSPMGTIVSIAAGTEIGD